MEEIFLYLKWTKLKIIISWSWNHFSTIWSCSIEIINESKTTLYLLGIRYLLSKCHRETDKKPGFCPDIQDFSKTGDYAGVICTRLLEGGVRRGGRMPKLFRWLMSSGELWADCVFSEGDWDFFFFFASGRLWHAAVIWMGPPSSVAGNFIRTAVMLRGEAFQILDQEVRALVNGSMVPWQGWGSFCRRMLQMKGGSAWPLHIFFSSLVFPLTLFLSLPFITDDVTRRLSPDVSSSVLKSSSPT